jgi:hypothetical protein
MKKIPTLFERVYKDHEKVGINPNVTEGMEWVLDGEGVATVKFDGACCAIIDGEFYKRYDAKSDPLGRLCLHAGELILRHPVTGEELTFRARTPKEFHRLFR